MTKKEHLTAEQQIVYDKLIEFVNGIPIGDSLFDDSHYQYFLLSGYAGTGKTFTISKFVAQFKGYVAMTAPTNKAVKVLYENRSASFNNVDYLTIHKLLALKVKWEYPSKGEPRQTLVQDSFNPPTLNEYDVLIIDESSMLDDELFNIIHASKKDKLKVIFMGDPAQIPPVGGDDALPFKEEAQREYNILHYSLSTVMRQATESSIIPYATEIRNQRFKNLLEIPRVNSKNINFYNPNRLADRQEFATKMFACFESDDFKQDSNYCKVIAWTNKVVDSMNTIIRQKLFKSTTLSQIMVGERLIADKPIMSKFTEQIILKTSDEFIVTSVTPRTGSFSIQEKVYVQASFDNIEGKTRSQEYFLKWFECEVVANGDEHVIDVLAEESEKPFQWLISATLKARQFKKFEQLQSRFGKVKYNYAITAHKSQGSTYDIVFIIEDDIMVNMKALERHRIYYTAVTRPKTHLYILSREAK